MNFTGRGVTGEQVGGLLQGLQQYQPSIVPSRLDLSDNNIGDTIADMTAFLPYLPQDLTYLDLSGNLIGTYDDNTVVLLGQALPNLPLLQFFKLEGPVQNSGIGSL